MDIKFQKGDLVVWRSMFWVDLIISSKTTNGSQNSYILRNYTYGGQRTRDWPWFKMEHEQIIVYRKNKQIYPKT